MKMFRNVLLSLLVVSVLSGCAGSTTKDFINRPASLVLSPMPADKELSCLPVEVFSVIITRDSGLSNRVQTLEEQIDAHNE